MVTYLGQTLYQVAFVFLIIWMLDYLIQFWMWETNLGYTDLICPTLPFKATSVKELLRQMFSGSHIKIRKILLKH